MAAGKLRDDDNHFLTNDFLSLKLGDTQPVDGISLTALTPPTNAKILARTVANKRPSLIRFSVGRGQVLVGAGEWLNAVNQQPLRQALSEMCEPARLLTFAPASAWIEYMVQRKGNAYVFPIFNHGRGLYPSRNSLDHGVWQGALQFDLAKLGLTSAKLAVWQAVYQLDAARPLELQPLPFTVTGSRLLVQLKVADFAEVVVGPHDEAQLDFFR